MAGRGRTASSVQERLTMSMGSLPREFQSAELQSFHVAEASTSAFLPTSMGIPANSGFELGGLEHLLEFIAKLDIHNEMMLKKIQFDILNYCSNSLFMHIFVQHVHKLALTDPVFGLRAAAALATASNLVVEGFKMRNILISALQADFARSEALRKKDISEFMNMVGFMGQVFSRVRINGEPIKVLSVPHLVYQKRLLQGDESELELCMLLLAQNGQLLSQCDTMNSTLLSDFFLQILFDLLNKELGKDSRGWLLLGYFLYSNDYKFNSDQYRLFTSVLGIESMLRIKCALEAGRSKLPIEVLEEKSLTALRAGPPDDEVN